MLLFALTITMILKSTTCTFMENLIDESQYNKYLYPTNKDKSSTNVTVQLYILALGPVDDTKNTYEVGYYFRLYWRDARLAYNESYGSQVLNVRPDQFIWTPDIVVANAKEANSVNENGRTLISPEGDVMFSQRVKAIARCFLNFRVYPFDTQICNLTLESYAYTKEQVDPIWHDKSVLYDGEEPPMAPGYAMVGVTSEKIVTSYKFDKDRTENFVNLEVSFKMKRSLVYYMFQTFVPSTLLMALNLGSYWIPVTAVPARITLIVTTFLASTIILQRATELTAKTDFLNPMQLFLSVNTLFIVISLVQFLIILSIKARQKEKDFLSAEKKKAAVKGYGSVNKGLLDEKLYGDIFQMKIENENIAAEAKKQEEKKKEENKPAHFLDRICRFLIPVLFAIFFITYWSYYLSHDH